ncbi:hypothetical protein [Synergistes jonesii]|uniref:hypothetical protein n=1 Tax=Synergistes jonesii TaxID=2754 RepID=UPI00114C88AD|nr:hypothetical protein [Synergistes jonesii]MDY2983783.1 hypothetical protein [Synergistes jonesii]
MLNEERMQLAEMKADSAQVLAARGVVKNFGGIRALRGAEIAVNAGKIVDVIGDGGNVGQFDGYK